MSSKIVLRKIKYKAILDAYQILNRETKTMTPLPGQTPAHSAPNLQDGAHLPLQSNTHSEKMDDIINQYG
jgi:hypothetical protein